MSSILSPALSSLAPATKGASTSVSVSGSGTKPIPTFIGVPTRSSLSTATPSTRKEKARHAPSHAALRAPGLSGIAAALASVDTSRASYPRTDPFTALNALLRLLALLPTRPGALAYRLSPAEHTLAVHLVGVIEPFVSVSAEDGMKRRALVRQPTEILDLIAWYVEDRADLVRLGTTCKRLWAVVSPRHLDYHTVRAKPSSLALWAFLAAHPSLALNIRALHIADERAPPGSLLLPPSFVNMQARDTDVESSGDELALHDKHTRCLGAAIARMGGLRNFKWACAHSGVRLTEVWPILMKCGGLKDVDVGDNGVFATVEEESDDDSESGSDDDDDDANANADGKGKAVAKTNRSDPKTLVLPDLTSIALSSSKHAFGAPKFPSLARIQRMLACAPNLQALNITYTPPRRSTTPSPGGVPGPGPGPGAPHTLSSRTPPRADTLLLTSRWPHLRVLTLSGLALSAGAGAGAGQEAACAFLAAHTQIEVLHLDVGRGLAHGYGHGYGYAQSHTSVGALSGAPTPLPGTMASPSAFMASAGGANGSASAAGVVGPQPSSPLEPGTLPRLRELHASREVATLLLSCPARDSPTPNTPPSPLETLRGLTPLLPPPPSAPPSSPAHVLHSAAVAAFIGALRPYGATLRRLELGGWGEMEDVRRVVEVCKGVVWLDVGRRVGSGGAVWFGDAHGHANASGGKGRKAVGVPNVTEWATLLSALPNLTTFHGVSFFYEVASESAALLNGLPFSVAGHGGETNVKVSPSTATLSTSDKSKAKKNKEIARVLAWKCPKLRRVDHWDSDSHAHPHAHPHAVGAGAGGAGAGGKVIVLVREGGEEVRYEVRRVKG